MTARLDRLEYICGQERKLIERHIDEGQLTSYQLTMIRHYENKRHKMYEKLKRVLEQKYGVEK